MSRSTASQKSFKTKLHHRRLSAVLKNTGNRLPGDRDRPIPIRLAPEPGVAPSSRPPVRIFIGTEPAQFRAERVLVWSIRRHRDPARTYEIHLMSNLKGFDRSTWKTGFTQYRYAIPALAGHAGRAIYNDVDQIYLADPAILFDQDMGNAALLSIDDRETSVMLLDCAKLAPLWTLEMAQRTNKHKVFRAAVHDAGLWGHMDPDWNARDDEYAEGRSKLLHFTTLHTQPWHPFPELLRYQGHAQSELWNSLEAEADRNHFTLFTEATPSERYRELLELLGTMHEEGHPDSGHSAEGTFSGISLTEHGAPIAELVGRHSATSVLDYRFGKATLYQAAPGQEPASRYRIMPAWDGARVTCYDTGAPPFTGPCDAKYDGVIATDVLAHIPAEDIPWVLHHLFGHARKFVYAVAACFPAKQILPDGTNAHCTLCPPEWWAAQMELVARAHPGVDWVLCAQEKRPFAFEQRKKLLKSGIRSHFFSAKSLSQAA